MLKNSVSGLVLMFLLVGMTILPFAIQPVKAVGAVYIRADGSIDPPSAPIQRNGDLYTLTDNITSNADGLVIQRNNMTLDGGGYTVNGSKVVSAGIRLFEVSNVTVRNIVVRGFLAGISAYGGSSNNSLTRNTITDNTQSGISISDSSNNDIIENNITSNRGGLSVSGIRLSNSSNNNIVGNYIFNNYGVGGYSSGYGIYAVRIRNNSIIGNNIKDNFAVSSSDGNGIFLGDASDTNIIGNNVTSTTSFLRPIDGIILFSAFNIMIFGNSIVGNRDGIRLSPLSSNNSIIANQVITNWGAGMDIFNATGNSIYHNSFVGNAEQVYIDYPGFPNAWDNGYPSGGNYWSDYAGVDANSDGIGDTPYVIDENNRDRYPLMNPWTVKWGTSISFTLSPNPVNPGGTVELSGTLKDLYGKPVYPAQVTVDYSTNGGVSWNYIWTLNTNAAGQFAQSFNAPGVGSYLVRASYAGSDAYNPSSYTQTLVVQTGGKVNTQIVFSFSPNPALPGQSVTLSGTLKTVRANPVYPASVTVEYSLNGGATWNLVFTLSTNAAGQFSQSFGAPGVGSYLVRASYAGSSAYNPSSSTQTLMVQTGGKVNTQIVFSFSPNPAKPSQSVTLSGTLKNVNGNPVYPAQVTVQYSTNGGATWIFGWTLSTNAAGQFSVSFGAPGVGTYLARVNYAGSTNYNPSSSTQTLAVQT